MFSKFEDSSRGTLPSGNVLSEFAALPRQLKQEISMRRNAPLAK
jgi:hypothetical protein